MCRRLFELAGRQYRLAYSRLVLARVALGLMGRDSLNLRHKRLRILLAGELRLLFLTFCFSFTGR